MTHSKLEAEPVAGSFLVIEVVHRQQEFYMRRVLLDSKKKATERLLHC